MLEGNYIGLPEQGVHYRLWDDECVVFNSQSGQTHLLDGVGAFIFQLLSKNVTTRTAVLEYAQNAFEFETGINNKLLMDNLILEYHKLGLLIITENPAA
ncbi:MAG: HPr-rel-A system PqqD family peptide chaperone [Methylococcaceae bacterium]|nr:HPr-rel-A system PqqD family peptide chaperone [Methylococcaceae bacterium]